MRYETPQIKSVCARDVLCALGPARATTYPSREDASGFSWWWWLFWLLQGRNR